MSAHNADRRMLAELLAGEARRQAGQPELPTPEELLAYHEGRLDPEEEARIGRCLVASPEAARRLLDVAELAAAATPSADDPEGGKTNFEREAAWRRLESELDQQADRPPAAAATPLPAAASRSRGPERWLARLAPVFAVAALGLSLHVRELESERRKPIVNAFNIELREDTRAAPREIALPAGGASPARFVLTAEGVHCPVYDAVLIRAGDAPLPAAGLQPDDLGRLNFWLLDIAPGDYTLVLSGCERELQRHHFTVLAAGRGAD